MGAAIGISNYQNNRRVSKRLLMVELRLDYKSSRNLSGTKLRRKFSHSRARLGMEVSIDPNDYFIFDDKIIEESRRKVSNLAIENGYKDRWNSLTVEEFNNYVHDAELLSYFPMASGNKKLVVRYNFNETKSICNTVIKGLERILDKYRFDDEETK